MSFTLFSAMSEHCCCYLESLEIKGAGWALFLQQDPRLQTGPVLHHTQTQSSWHHPEPSLSFVASPPQPCNQHQKP